MRNFSFKTKQNSRQTSSLRSLVRVVMYTGIAIVAVFFVRDMLGAFAGGAVTTVMKVEQYIETSGAALPTYIRERRDLERTIANLEESLAAESGSSVTAARLSAENEELRALLGDVKDTRILAGIVARPPRTPYDLLVIDKGSDDGIIEGAIVYHVDSHIIGTVSRVFPRSALVTLFGTGGVETTVYVYGPNVFAYAYGEGGGVMRISLPQGVRVQEGDVVVLPSVGEGDLGVIERVVSVPTEPEQSAYLTYPVSLQSMRLVTVGTRIPDTLSYDALEAEVEAIHARFKVELPSTYYEAHSSSTPTTTPEAASSSPGQL